MRVAVLAVMVGGGCFSPTVPSYIPCASAASSGERCPSGQVCVAFASSGDLCVPTSEADVDAPPELDAPIDGPSDAAIDAPLTWVAIEMLTIPSDAMIITSATTLAAGTMYRLRASGTLVVATGIGLGGDAEYIDFSTPMDGVPGIDQGLAIEDIVVDGTKQPKWGPYTASHVYEVPWQGTGTKIRAQYHDGNYTNNAGSLMLTILALQ
jgi:hypothetical protein